MTRLILLLAATGFASACMSNGPAMDPSPQATTQQSLNEPTDGLDNETTGGINQSN